jgi:putative phosphoribosyl transferase
VCSDGLTSLEDSPADQPRGARFKDRPDAGRRLATLLEPFRPERPVVLGLPRGGVPVAAEVARALRAPLDVAVVRKIGAPQNREYAIGALAEGGVRELCEETVRAAGLSPCELDALIERAAGELDELVVRYRGRSGPAALTARTVIVVDDGLATGRSALAAVSSSRRRGAARVILAAPIASPEAAGLLAGVADAVVCVDVPVDLWAVGAWYEDFRAPSDEEVAVLLSQAPCLAQ